jgi:hypothetical protein
MKRAAARRIEELRESSILRARDTPVGVCRAAESARGMPRRQGPKKDAGDCEKPRGAVDGR